MKNANINQHSVLIRLKKDINPYYVSTFLNCVFEKKQSDKNIVGLSRPALDYKTIKKVFIIPILSIEFQNFIEKIVKNAHKKLSDSHSLYSQAEELLLSELGLWDWKPKHTLTFVKNFSDTQKAERIYAEYFQPKYEEIIEALKGYKGGFVILGEVAKTKRGFLISDSYYNEKEGTPYIRGADFPSGFLNDINLFTSINSFHQNLKRKSRKVKLFLL